MHMIRSHFTEEGGIRIGRTAKTPKRHAYDSEAAAGDRGGRERRPRYQSRISHPFSRAVRESGRSGDTARGCSAAARMARSEWWSP